MISNLGPFQKINNFSKIINLLKNAGWIFFDRIFRIATGLIISVWIARYLGPDEFGVLNYVYVFPLIFSSLVSLGLTNTLFNEFIIHKDSLSIKSLLATSIIMKMVAGLLAFGLIIGISAITEKDPQMVLLIAVSAVSLVAQSLDVVDTYFQSQRKVQYSIIPKLIVFAIATGFRAFALWNESTILVFVVITSVELLVSSLINLIICLQYTNLGFPEIRLNQSIAKDLLRRSWPLMLSELFLFLYARVDLLMIKKLSENAEVGNYSVAMRITDLWYFIPMALTASLYPSIITLRKVDYQEYLNRYRRMLSGFALISISIGLLITLFANPFIHFLYGEKYARVAIILSINIWNGLFVFLAIGSDNWFITENLQKYMLRRTIIGAAINVALNFVLIPSLGAIGASIATMIAQVSVTYVMNGFYSKTKEIFILQTQALFFLPRYIAGLMRRVF